MSESIKKYLASMGIDSLEVAFTDPHVLDDQMSRAFEKCNRGEMDGGKEGVKFDQGKLRMDLLPTDALEALARILTDGAEKYGARNWEKGMAWSRSYAALQRHLLAWWGGQDNDPESGHPHLWHVLTNAVFLTSYQIREIGEDDRP